MKLVALLFATTSLSATLQFSELRIDYSGIPAIEKFSARDQEQLDYRFYPSSSETLLILLHGSGWHSRYFFKMAKTLGEGGVAKVLTPDLRGHGEHPKKRGDVDYIGQFDDDLVDLIKFARKKYSPRRIILGGHSSGGGLALRFAGSVHQDLVDGFVFLAPYLKHDAPTVKQDAGWAEAKIMRVIGLSLLNTLGIHMLDHVVTLTFNLPKKYRDGTETLEYTHTTVVSFTPDDYEKDFKALRKPTLLLVGGKDEAMVASAFSAVVPKAKSFQAQILLGISHMGVVVNPVATQALSAWLEKQSK